MALGLIVAGDYALATGADRHVAFVAAQLAISADSLAWAWIIPADRVQLAAALFEAWQRCHPVACFGGLGDGVDDHTRATVEALQHGRDDVGLPRHVVDTDAAVLQVRNVAFFPGDPARSHVEFAQWWQRTLASRGVDEGASASEQVRWTVPEAAASMQARRQTKIKHPSVTQRLIATGDGETVLRLSGSSKGKVQAARKALHAALKHSEERRKPR